MRVKFKLIPLVFVIGYALLSSSACIGATSSVFASADIVSSVVGRPTVKTVLLASTTSTPTQAPKGETKLVASSDVIAQGSVVPGCLNILVLIAVLCSLVHAHTRKEPDPPVSESFSRILFRVIISPNAP